MSMNKIIGIYKIESKCNPNKIYIGSSINIKDRFGRHKVDFKRNEHANYKMQRHYNKYGNDDFVFSIIEECDKREVIIREQYYIDTLNPWFNICKIAGSYKGVKQTKEALKKREGRTSWNKGLKGDENPMTGNKPCSEETKLKLSEYFKGKPSGRKGFIVSEETREKMSKARIGKVPWNKGKKMSEEYKNKQKEKIKLPSWKKGTTLSTKVRENMRLAWIKRKLKQTS